MPPVRVGEPLDVVQQGESGRAPRREAVAGEQLAFERGEGALRGGVVDAIAAAPHRAHEPGFSQPPPPSTAGVPAPLVGVMNDGMRWPPPDRHVDGFDSQSAASVLGHRPAANAAVVDVGCHRAVKKPAHVGTQAMSATHKRSGAAAKSRRTGLGTGTAPGGRGADGPLRRWQPCSPARRSRRATRSREYVTPLSRSSAQMRGVPYVPRLRWCAAGSVAERLVAAPGESTEAGQRHSGD